MARHRLKKPKRELVIHPYEGERDKEEVSCAFYEECWSQAVSDNAARVPCGRRGGKKTRGCPIMAGKVEKQKRSRDEQVDDVGVGVDGGGVHSGPVGG